MKQIFMAVMSAAVLCATASGAGAATPVLEFELDENYQDLEPASGEEALAEGEIDPNALAEGEEMPLPKAEPVKPAEKPENPTPKPVKPAEKPTKVVPSKAPEPREIPLIETRNETRSHPDVSFVTGGIGDDEKQAIEAAKADYNLHVMSASDSGAFVGDSHVLITRKSGQETEEMLSVTAGPLLYVRLPSGSYSLEATLGSQTKKQTFTVSKKGAPARVHLGWKVPAVKAE